MERALIQPKKEDKIRGIYNRVSKVMQDGFDFA